MDRNHIENKILTLVLLGIVFFNYEVGSKSTTHFRVGSDQNHGISVSQFARGSVKSRSANPCGLSDLPCLQAANTQFRGGRSLHRNPNDQLSFKPSQPVFFTKTMEEALSPSPLVVPSQQLELPRLDSQASPNYRSPESCADGEISPNCHRPIKQHVPVKDEAEMRSKMFILSTKPTVTAILVQSKDPNILKELTRRTILDQIALHSRSKNTLGLVNFNGLQNIQSKRIFDRSTKGSQDRSSSVHSNVESITARNPCSDPNESWRCSSNAKPFEHFNSNKDSLKASSRVVTKFQQHRLNAKYDKCSHPFHSWQCSKRKHKPTMISITTQKPIVQPRQQLGKANSNIIQQKSKKYDKCSHPFHSWLCQLATRPASNKNAISDIQLTTKKFFPTTTPKPFSFPSSTKASVVKATNNRGKSIEDSKKQSVNHETYDKCTHSFHAWLCPKRPKVNQVPTTERPRTTKQYFPITTYSRNIGKSLDSFTKSTTKAPSRNYDKCSHAFHSWLCNNKKSTTITTPKLTPEPSQIQIPKELNTATPNTDHGVTSNPKYDKCSHPFHSWLCQRVSNQKTPKQFIQKINKEKDIKVSDDAGKQDCSNSPQLEKCKQLGKADSKDNPQSLKEPRVTQNKKQPSSRENSGEPSNYKKCNHAFHKWLCQENNDARTSKPLEKPKDKPKGKSLGTTQPKIEPRRPISTTPLSTHYSKVNPCNHAFHSWLCRENSQRIQKIIKTVTPKPKQEPKGKSLHNTPSVPNIVPKPSPAKSPKQTWDGANPCSHAFHAWLCQPLRPRLVGPQFSPPRPSQTHYFNIQKALNSNPSTGLNVDNLKPKGVSHQIERSSRELTSQSPTNQELNQTSKFYSLEAAKAKSSSHTEATLKAHCNHPFHPWMCTTFANRHPDFPLLDIPDIRSLPLESESLALSQTQRHTRKAKPVTHTRVTDNRKSFQPQNIYPYSIASDVPSQDASSTKPILRSTFLEKSEKPDIFAYSELEPLKFESKRIVPLRKLS